MRPTLTQDRKEKLADYYADGANASSASANETEHHLCGNLISASLAFLALIMIGVSNNNILEHLCGWQKFVIAISAMSFVISIFAGLINYVLGICLHHRAFANFGQISKDISKSTEKTNLASIQKRIDRMNQPKNLINSKVALIIQFIALAVGTIMALIFIFSVLF